MKRMIINTIVSVILGTALISAPVSADDVTVTRSTIDESKTGSVTIYKIKENDGNISTGDGLTDENAAYVPMAGIEFAALRIAGIESLAGDSKTGTYFTDVDSSFTDLLEENGIEAESVSEGGKICYTSESLMTALDALNKKGGEVPGSVLLTEYIKNSSSAVKFSKTDENGRAVLTELPLGLYIIAETDSSGYIPGGESANALPEAVSGTTLPFFVSVPMTNQSEIGGNSAGTLWQYDVTVYPKNQTASIPKYIISEDDNDTLILTEDAECGETVLQLITSDIPDPAGSLYEKYEVKDTMEEGLEYKNVTAVKLSDPVSEPEKVSQFEDAETLIKDEDYEIAVSDDKRLFTVKLLERGLSKINLKSGMSQLAIVFETYVTGDIKESDPAGASNIPELTMKTDSGAETVITGNEPTVFSYRLVIEKDGLTEPNTAQFSVVKDSTGETLRFVKDDDGIYHIYDRSEDAENESEIVESINPAGNGDLVIRGIDSDTYTITENATQTGYELLSSSFKVEITGNDPADGNLKSAKVIAGESSSDLTVEGGTAYLTLENHPSIELRTGGTGRGAIYGTGGAAVLALIALSLKKKKSGIEHGSNDR